MGTAEINLAVFSGCTLLGLDFVFTKSFNVHLNEICLKHMYTDVNVHHIVFVIRDRLHFAIIKFLILLFSI